jgi:hypothetical protein
MKNQVQGRKIVLSENYHIVSASIDKLVMVGHMTYFRTTEVWENPKQDFKRQKGGFRPEGFLCLLGESEKEEGFQKLW